MIGTLVGLRRAGVVVLWTFAVALGFASSGSSRVAGPAPPPPGAYLDSLLYPGTVRPDSSCANPRSCTHADLTFTNPEKFVVNSFMIEITGDPFKSVKLDGEPPCTSTGGKFGPNFETDWLCLGLKVEPGATITGSLIATKPLTPTTSARFDWSNKGSQGGMLPDYAHEIPFYWIPASPPTPVELITDAIAKENDAIKYLDEIHPNMNPATERDLRKTAVDDLGGSVGELEKARAALGSVNDLLDGAARLDREAAHEINTSNRTGVREIVNALGQKRIALAIAKKAAPKK
jgi:hypothetical protein